jgi:predicted dehydrogenase
MANQFLQPLRIGVIGAGVFGRLHAVTLGGLAVAELVALVDRDMDRAKRVGEELGGVPVWGDLDEALSASSAEAWIIAASTAAHVPLAKKILEARCSLLVEKPLAASLTDAQSLGDAVRGGPGKLMMGHVGLFNSEFRQLMVEVRQRGGLRFIDAVRHRPAAFRERFPDESLFELLMVHDLYYVQAMVEGREPAAFHASEDGNLALAELKWADGLTARLAASMLTPPGMAGDGYDRMEVFGDGWSARVRPNPRPIELWDDRARWPLELEIGPGPRGMLAEELRCFCRVVRGLEPIPAGASYEDAMQIQRWLDRLVSSTASAPTGGISAE